MTPSEKYCPDCKEVRPREEFYKNQNHYDGLSSYCGKHQLKRNQKYFSKAPHRTYMRDYMRQVRNRPRIIKVEKPQDQSALPPDNRPRCTCGAPLYGKVCIRCTPKRVENDRLEQARRTLAANCEIRS